MPGREFAALIRSRSPANIGAHGQLSKAVSSCPNALGHRPKAFALDGATIPAPSFRGRAAALGRPVQGGRVAHALALCRRLAVPFGAVLFRHCGPFGPLGGRLAAAGACRSGAAGAPGLRCASLAAVRLRSAAARFPSFLLRWSFLPLVGPLCSGIGGPAARLWAPGGPSVCALLCRCGRLAASLPWFFVRRPPVAWLRLAAAVAAAFPLSAVT